MFVECTWTYKFGHVADKRQSENAGWDAEAGWQPGSYVHCPLGGLNVHCNIENEIYLSRAMFVVCSIALGDDVVNALDGVAADDRHGAGVEYIINVSPCRSGSERTFLQVLSWTDVLIKGF
jgi:hypothetical protein